MMKKPDMEIIRSIDELTARTPSVVTVGVFDGVHLGHQTIMRIVRADAEERKARSVAVTFDRMPEELVHPSSNPVFITTLDEKLNLIAAQGIDLTVVLPLEQHILDITADDFIHDILCRRLCTVQLVVGATFGFGKGRAGNLDMLRREGAECGFGVLGMSAIEFDGELVSSTVIRRLIADGDIDRANEMLGRPFMMQGEVVRGEGIGTTLGFPTANIAVPERQVMPARGVYACTVNLDGRRWVGAMNIGTRPTVGGQGTLVEVYLIGFSGELYGRELRVEFHHRLRAETKFPDREALTRQIQVDVQQIAEMLEDGTR